MGVNVKAKEMTLTANAADTPDRLTLTIPRGQTYKITLSDGSEVWMNNDCRLVYPNYFTGKERRVKVEGEAYFKVAPDAKHPFIVVANGIEAKVLRTEFNVRSYGNADTHVTLIKGKVAVRTDASHEAVLTPGQDAQLNDDGTLGIADVDIDSYLYWRDGYFYFDNVALENIMQDIGRWYNLNVVFANNDVRNYHLHFLADKRGGIDHVVKLLNGMGKMNVTLKDNTLTILSLKKKFNGNSEDEAGRFRKPDREYVVMMTALCDVIYDNNIQDPEILKIGREAASLAANWGDQSCRSSFKVQELSLRYAQAVYNRSAKSLVTNLKYARQDNDTKKIEVLESILKKYGISESENEEISKDHQHMMLDEKEQKEHMAKKKK